MAVTLYDPVVPVDDRVFSCIASTEGLADLAAKLKDEPVISIDWETTTAEVWRDDFEVLGLAVAASETEGYYIPIGHELPEDRGFFDKKPPKISLEAIWEALGAIFQNSTLIVHNAKFDIYAVCQKIGWDLTQDVFDTYIAAGLTNSSRELKLNLKHLTRAWLGRDAKEIKDVTGSKSYNMKWSPIELVTEYGAADASNTYGLYQITKAKLEKWPRIQDIFTKLEMPIIPVVSKMEQMGFRVDTELLRKIHVKAMEDITKAHATMQEIAGYPFDPKKSDHRRHMLYDVLCLPAARRQGKETTERKQLQLLFQLMGDEEQANARPFFEAFVTWSVAEKIRSTYTYNIIEKLDQYGRIHPSFFQIDTATGRMCVSGDTVLETSAGEVCISDLELTKNQNVTILTHRGRQQRIRRKFFKGVEPMFEVTLENNSKITCTMRHRFLTQQGWRELRQLQVGAELLVPAGQGGEGHRSKIASIVPVGPRGVWDIEVGEDHSYAAQGFWNHNSSGKPINFQNIPRDKKTYDVRAAFIPDPGWKLILADYVQMEFKIGAALCGDPTLVDIANDTEADVHLTTARACFGIPDNEPVPDEKRQAAKTMTYALQYGASQYGVAKLLLIPEREARRLIEAFYGAYAGLAEWSVKCRQRILEHGYSETYFGRRRWGDVKVLQSHNEDAKETEYRKLGNMIVQGTGADVTKLAMKHVTKWFHDENMQSFIVGQIHDELVILSPDAEADTVMVRVEEIMTSKVEAVTLPVDASIRSSLSKSPAALLAGKG